MGSAAGNSDASGPSLRYTVITLSNSRTIETDPSGDILVRELEAAGHSLIERSVVPRDPEKIRWVLDHWLRAEVDAIFLTGGTSRLPQGGGAEFRAGSIEIVAGAVDIELEGFGQLLRQLQFDAIGSPALYSRSIAGIAGNKVVFALPGSRRAVRLALERLILPELGRLVERSRGSAG